MTTEVLCLIAILLGSFGLVGVVIAGVVVHHHFKLKRDNEWREFLKGEALYKVKDAVFDSLDNCMDLIPLKLLKARETLGKKDDNGGGTSWSL